jgi:hypothetical protein
MNVVQPNCRIQFTREDFALIRNALGGGRGLEQLLQDDETLRDLLDDPHLVNAIQDNPAQLNISAHLYFYLLTRKVLREAHLPNRDVAEYLAEMLVYFADARHLKWQVASQSCEYFHEMLQLLPVADAETAFRTWTYMGNYALFMVGVFPERIQHRASRTGAPSVRFYAGVGMNSYRVASKHRLAAKYAVGEVLAGLAANFEPVCQALRRLTEQYLCLAV